MKPLEERAFYQISSEGVFWLYNNTQFGRIFAVMPSKSIFFVVRVEKQKDFVGDIGFWYRIIFDELVGFIHVQYREYGLLIKLTDENTTSPLT